MKGIARINYRIDSGLPCAAPHNASPGCISECGIDSSRLIMLSRTAKHTILHDYIIDRDKGKKVINTEQYFYLSSIYFLGRKFK